MENVLNYIHSTERNRWYGDEFESGYGFDTYDSSQVLGLISEELKYRDTGNAFLNFGIETMKIQSSSTFGFSGQRGHLSGDRSWLDLDSTWNIMSPSSYNDQYQRFQAAYTRQVELREAALQQFSTLIENMVDDQESIL